MATKKSARKATARAAPGGNLQLKMVRALHQVWLAGLGAVARTQQGAPQLFEELVAEGAKLQADTQEAAQTALRDAVAGMQSKATDVRTELEARLSAVGGQASQTLESLEKVFQTRVRRTLTQLGVPTATDIAALSHRVDTLNSNIEKLARHDARPAKARKAKRSATATAAHSRMAAS